MTVFGLKVAEHRRNGRVAQPVACVLVLAPCFKAPSEKRNMSLHVGHGVDSCVTERFKSLARVVREHECL